MATLFIIVPNKKFYVMFNGKRSCIYNSYNEYSMQVTRFKRSIYKSYISLEDALTITNTKKKTT